MIKNMNHVRRALSRFGRVLFWLIPYIDLNNVKGNGLSVEIFVSFLSFIYTSIVYRDDSISQFIRLKLMMELHPRPLFP